MYSPQSDEIAAILEKKATPERIAVFALEISKRLESSHAFDKYDIPVGFERSNKAIIHSEREYFHNALKSFMTKSFLERIMKKLYPDYKCVCEACGSSNTELQRAHHRDLTLDIAAMGALLKIRPDEIASVNKKVLVIEFIKQHHLPPWYLCEPCHQKYDSKISKQSKLSKA